MGPDDGRSSAIDRLADERCRAPAQNAAITADPNLESPPLGARIMAWLVIVVAGAFVVLGIAWYGISPHVSERIWRDLLERPDGPMTFRFFLQPATAAIVAIYDGLKDARTGRTPYFWSVVSNRAERIGRLREGLFSIARIILLGISMDVIYQYVVLKRFYPVEALLITLLLAVMPYFLIRGPANRIATWWIGPGDPKMTTGNEK
jgi:hypothetical protein